MTEILDTGNAIGRPIRRKEDAKLLHGRTNWTDNIQLPGTLHMGIVRSPMAHARITKVDLSAALAMPNVVAAFDAEALGDLNAGVPCVWPVTDDTLMPPFPALTGDKVRHVGDCIAVVLATDPASAEDAIAYVDVEYEPLPAVVGMVDAVSPGMGLVHDDIPNNTCYVYPFGGGFDEVAAKADRVVKRRFVNQRLIPAFMEPRAVVAAPMGMSDEMTLWTSTQIPHVLRVLLTLVTGIPEQNLRIVAPDVGGGFGGKLQCYREEILALQLARKLGRPVKWNETRSEDMLATHHGRDHIQDVELAVTNDGQDPRPARRHPGQHGRLPADHHAGHPDPGHVHVPGDLQDGRLRVQVHRHLHEHDPDGRLPRRGPARGDLQHRAHRRRGGRRAGHGPDGVPQEELDRAPTSSRSQPWRDSPTTPATTRRPPLRRWTCSATTRFARSSRRAASRVIPSSWASASRPSRRCAAWLRPEPWAR